MRDNIGWRVRLYEFLAAPAHIWLWLCARICGGRFECGPVSHGGDDAKISQ